jgi:hypothetical protein
LISRKKMPLHARAKHTHIAEKDPMEIAAARQCSLSCVVGSAGGHAKPAKIDADGRLLLPLPARKKPWKLRKDVRAAEIRVTLVGDVLREVAQPLQRR